MAAPQVATAVASWEQEELTQLQRAHQALQNRLLLERSQLGSTAGALQVTARFVTTRSSCRSPFFSIRTNQGAGGCLLNASWLSCFAMAMHDRYDVLRWHLLGS